MATNSKPKTKSRTFKQFLKANAALVVIIACVLAISGIIIGESIANNKPAKRLPVIEGTGIIKQIEGPGPGPDPDPVNSWQSPVKQGKYTIGMDFSLDEYTKCNTLSTATVAYWFIHEGVDFLTVDGEAVVAAFDGVVESITEEVLEGTIVVINHGEGLKSVYWSLSDTVAVRVGQAVESGDIIGYASTSAYSEFMDGAHVHFEMSLNGNPVDPRAYFEIAA